MSTSADYAFAHILFFIKTAGAGAKPRKAYSRRTGADGFSVGSERTKAGTGL